MCRRSTARLRRDVMADSAIVPSSKVRNFRELRLWQEAMDLAVLVHQAAENLPHSERFELGREMRRSATSVPSNVAEGFSRHSRRIAFTSRSRWDPTPNSKHRSSSPSDSRTLRKPSSRTCWNAAQLSDASVKDCGDRSNQSDRGDNLSTSACTSLRDTR